VGEGRDPLDDARSVPRVDGVVVAVLEHLHRRPFPAPGREALAVIGRHQHAPSPDERTLYVANSDPEHAVRMAYDLADDGTVGAGRGFFDATPWVGEERPGLPDGLAVDRDGNLFATGPGGVLVLSPDGRHLGTLDTAQATANCAFGDDGGTLYVTADAYLLRMRLRTTGLGF